jgi:hypothetical protein
MVGAVVVALGLVLGACGSDDVSREDRIDELVSQSGGEIDEEQATCIVDGLIAEFGEDVVEEDSAIESVDQTKLGEITVDCLGFGDLLEDPGGSLPAEGVEE